MDRTCSCSPGAAPHEEGRCVGHVGKADQGDVRPCRNAPIHGATVCRYHGGAAGHVRRAAAARAQDARVEAAAARWFQGPVEGDPTEVMLAALAHANGWMLTVRQLVEALDDADVVEPSTETRGAEVSPLVRLYERAVDAASRLAERCRRAGIEEARIAMAAGQADALVDGLLALVAALGLTEAQQALVPGLLTGLLDRLAAPSGR